MSVEKKSLTERLEDHLAQRRAEVQAAKDKELLARAEQVRTIQGMLGPARTVHCPRCGELILDPRPTAPDDDYDTRI